MISFLVRKILGSKNDREVKRLRPVVAQINEHEQKLQSVSDEELRAKTAAWKAELAPITDDAELKRRLLEILPEAFAVVKNACRRLNDQKVKITVRGHELEWAMIPFDVQLIGGMALHRGSIAEMQTGEGKTLVATLPTYLNALTGRGVHVVTVNDYLAARDAEWMGAVYRYLGLTVGVILHDMPPHVRRQMYAADITYGTNAEFGFDYLRDNGMATRAEEQVQRGHYYAIVDEVDSILVDEARTPLIISGPAVISIEHKFQEAKPLVAKLEMAQQELCEKFLAEAKAILGEARPTDGSNPPKNADDLEFQASKLLLRVKMGQPRAKSYLALMEEPRNQSLVSRVEGVLLADQSKKEYYAQKEELFFAIEERSHEADLTEKGRLFISPNDPDAFMLPDLPTLYHNIETGPEADPHKRIEAKAKVQAEFEERASTIHAISQLLKAYCLYEKDVHYVVMEGKVIIVDENTGRLMTGRRWSDGLHQAVEAKEGVTLERETQTLATVTIQNYFRLYKKLAGMTGTAETEAQEFHDIYKLGVVSIPPNRQNIRKDSNDTVYKTKREKFDAVVREIGEKHNVLNAKYHEREAEIIVNAGAKNAVTISTNMAGRGTDIKLGAGVTEIGGLHVLGTERHESRRIDRQLRGRCSRQGDPGSSHFFISLEDDLMRLFGSDRIAKVMERMGLEEGQELEHPLLNRSIEQAQKRVEQHNFMQRKRVLEYDDVMNKQREVVYGFRNQVLHGTDVRDRLMDILEEVVHEKVQQFTEKGTDVVEWNLRGLGDWVNLNFPVGVPEKAFEEVARAGKELPQSGSMYDGLSEAQFALVKFIHDKVRAAYELKSGFEKPDAIASIERYTMLEAIDRLWQEHLYSMDSLRSSIGLRAYGQKDPLIEYKGEAYKMFAELMGNIKTEICANIFRSASSLMAFEQFLVSLPKLQSHGTASAFEEARAAAESGPAESGISGVDPAALAATNEALDGPSPSAARIKATPMRNTTPRVGRNDPCPCGSSKKYKNCHGK